MTSSESSTAPDFRALLCVNGAEEHIQLCLLAAADPARGGEAYHLLHFEEHAIAGRANPVLVPAMQRVLQQCAIPLELGALGVACVRGPGSFTGLRLTLSACLGLAEALDLPLAGMDYLPLAASAALSRMDDDVQSGSLFIASHARRRQIYCQGFSIPGGEPLTRPDVLALEEVPAFIAAHPGPHYLAGTGLERNKAPLGALLADAGLTISALTPEQCRPAAATFLAAAPSLSFSRRPIEPLYLRGSDAEENLPSIAALRGLSVDEAESKIRRARSNSA
ncbi:tRNA (adenosine(37)-N6)-threonylcarbamoyltransferase complex dimerization subunit type 1 TsaB [Oceanidesulfovibrio indonesiensis]|uniref:tRNA (Adenosine(37)-N6)-threonylcarbamoyltransferase complex dimerization subunit type 1 TsaB n=1 Tax=Oceanidesulfovibrio indonesiensis TaxID=54767 RepID=A0A7M3MDC9_9BACT|nr:tRNA (adenosine(37)-N6)-threonylcarbamoyltransferase complex dimerization subunit type 1 TsaB [Oceanidesulfovibrio indonesiensis]TVM16218.1 tRNA (adenosine(37)-N6)-threonylcarbamoyltransferase complex dimerization subunit type 1 TsaB [Oceanidesulfovibrio indonesiensis]